MNSNFYKIPNLIKTLLILILLIGNLVVKTRLEPNLYNMIFIFIVALILLIISIYIICKRDKPKSINLKGEYRYKKIRIYAVFIIGFISGLFIAFLIFRPNRTYVINALLGTKPLSTTFEVREATSTVTQMAIKTISPEIPFQSSTPSIFVNQVTSTKKLLNAVEINTTSTPEIIFFDNFVNNNNGWNLGFDSTDFSTKIVGGKFIHTANCLSSGYGYYCQYESIIPHINVKNFQMKFDTAIIGNTNTIITIKFRYDRSDYYYVAFSPHERYCRINLLYDGNLESLHDTIYSNAINQGYEAINNFGINVIDEFITVYANGKEILRIEDGNLQHQGAISIGIFVPKGKNSKVEFDNLIITDTH